MGELGARHSGLGARHSGLGTRRGESSIGGLLVGRAGLTPGRWFLRFGQERLTFEEAEAWSGRVAARLTGRGVGPGDRVGIMLPNGVEYVLTWLAVVRLGAVVVPINVGYQERDATFVLRDSGAGLLVTVTAHLPLLDRIWTECPDLRDCVAWDGGFREEVAAATAGADPAVPTDAIAVLQYTSGTTGFPKGCMTTHQGWLGVALGFADEGRFTEDDVAVIMTPFYYGDFGWNLVLSLMVGMELVLLPKFSASGLWPSIVETGGTFFYCLGTMPILLQKQPENPAVDRGHRVKWVSCSGIPADQHAELERRWGVPWREWYGTTEIGFAIAMPLGDSHMTGSGSIGRLLPGYQGRLVDATGHDVPAGAIGEFICRGPAAILGYWNNAAATAAWMQNGWAHTGDLMRQDEHGYYYLVGRSKDMIRRGGENIAAAEVEAALCEHPAVRNAACVAVPDSIRGEEVLAFVQPVGESPEPEVLLEHCRQRLAGFKVPRYLSFVAEFPLTPSQRVEKHKLPRDVAGIYDTAARSKG